MIRSMFKKQVKRELTNYEKGLKLINRFYNREQYGYYESAIAKLSRIYCKPFWQVEDDATDVRMLGIDGV